MRRVPPATGLPGGGELACTVTHTRPASTTTPSGLPPTGIAFTRSVRGSMRDTPAPRESATQTAPKPTARPRGPAPTGMIALVSPVAGSIRVTVSSRVLATHTAPAPTATPLAPFPTGRGPV